MADMNETILDAAQHMAQATGYNGFSFRDLAAHVGIKPASVYYHYPTKERLGAAVAARYTERLIAELGGMPSAGSNASELLRRYVAVFRATLETDGRMCLCGMLAAEVDSLPKAVQAEVERFVDANVSWLVAALRLGPTPVAKPAKVRAKARAIFAALEGAMLVARGTHDLAAFDEVVETYVDARLIEC